jgi:hypothetical protein
MLFDFRNFLSEKHFPENQTLLLLCIKIYSTTEPMQPTFYKAIFLIALLHFSKFAVAQNADKTKHFLNFSGTISANNNGFSLVPTFSLGKPAVQTGFNISGNKGRFSFHPQFWYSMLDYKPWSFIFIWRYQLVKKEDFEFIVGTHAPAINFRSATVTEDSVQKDVLKARRFYPALEVLPYFHLNQNISLSFYYLFGTGIEKEISSKNHFLSFRTDFNDIPLTKQLYLKFNPQVYYLQIGDTNGIYAAGSLALAHRKWPLSVSTMMNKALKSDIAASDFEWNVGLTYAFGRNYVSY